MLKQRVITALILALLVVASVFLLNAELVTALFALVLFLAATEWARLAGLENTILRTGYAVMTLLLAYLLRWLALPLDYVLLAATLFWGGLVLPRMWTPAGPEEDVG